MYVIRWIIIGLIEGLIGRKIVNKSGKGMFLEIEIGVVGEIIGGVILKLLGEKGVKGINI